MASLSKIIVGLGNPGADYSLNRHNIGFMLVDALAEIAGNSTWQSKFKGEIAKARLDGFPLLLLKPQTYMNLSGESVGELLRYYKMEAEDVIAIHDDIDLTAGQIKVKQGGGHGGHNGLKSLDAHIGKNYWRVRCGVGRPAGKKEVTNHVLGNFSKEDQNTWLPALLGTFPKALPYLIEDDAQAFLKEMRSAEELS